MSDAFAVGGNGITIRVGDTVMIDWDGAYLYEVTGVIRHSPAWGDMTRAALTPLDGGPPYGDLPVRQLFKLGTDRVVIE
jgi:hypothetical protein